MYLEKWDSLQEILNLLKTKSEKKKNPSVYVLIFKLESIWGGGGRGSDLYT